jgi:protein TonB
LVPVAVNRVHAPYPEAAREANVDGVVTMAALVCEHGRVIEVRVVQSIRLLDLAAAEAVRQWTFRPPLVHGQPVAVWTEVPYRFSLR